MKKIVVTRHRALVEYLKELGLTDDNTEVISHANIEDVKGKHVIGVLPLWLSCHASKITEIQIRIPKEKRGKDLSLEDIKFYSGNPKTYIVKETSFE